MPHPTDGRRFLVEIDPDHMARSQVVFTDFVMRLKDLAEQFDDDELAAVVRFLRGAAEQQLEATRRLTGSRRPTAAGRNGAAGTAPSASERPEPSGASDADRVPDRLGLQERRHPGEPGVGGPVRLGGRGPHDPLDRAGRLALELHRAAERGAGQVDAVDVGVLGQPRAQLARRRR